MKIVKPKRSSGHWVAYVGKEGYSSFRLRVQLERHVPVEWPYPDQAAIEAAMKTSGDTSPTAHPYVREWRTMKETPDYFVTGTSRDDVIRQLLLRELVPRGCSPEEVERIAATVKLPKPTAAVPEVV